MKVEIKNGSMYTVNPAGASPMSSFATGYAASPPRMPVPSASAAQVGASLPVKRKISPQHRAPTMLPGKASRLPMPSRLRIRLAQNAIPTPHHGPRMTAENTLTICWTGSAFASGNRDADQTSGNGSCGQNSGNGKFLG